jgi:GWxTD domain-containing protein
MRGKHLVWFLAFTLGLSCGVAYSPAASQKSKASKKREGSRTDYFKKWLDEDAVYIISEEEKKVFKDLQTEEEREKFIEQFWLRRDSDPRTPENEFKEEHYRRIAYANERFASGIPGWKTDRGRIYITFGEPAEIQSHPTGGTYQREIHEGGGSTTVYPFEKWRYRHIDGVGDDVEIEFVDKSMTGEYRMAMNPEEKDALLLVPGAGLTLAEELGLSKKEDRPYFSGMSNDPTQTMFQRAKDAPFARMEQFFNLQRPPRIKFDDLRSIVTTKVTYNQLAYDMRTDFIRLSSDKVLVPITVELHNQDLQFKKELDFNRAAVNVYGLVTSLTGRIMAEFEHVITTEYTDQFFAQGKQNRSIYQKIVALPPGQRFRIDLVLKDINSGNTGSTSVGIAVPKYDADSLQSSTIIFANSVTSVPTDTDRLEQYVIGDLKVQPNVRSEYNLGQNLIPYLQIYNATPDQTSQKPSVEISYVIKSGDKVIEEVKDVAGASIQFFSGQRVVVVGKLPLTSVTPGKYTLEVKVLDRVSNRTLNTQADFNVKEATVRAAVAQ